MANIAYAVFTGACELDDGTKIVRAALTKAANKAGIAVLPAYKPSCSYLIASRTDTVKAKKAKADGRLVMTYDQFVEMLEHFGVNARDPIWSEGAQAHPIVDANPAQPKPVSTLDAAVAVL